MAGSTEVEVRVLREGKEIKRILRPVRTVNGRAMVVYKGTFHLLRPGSVIELSQQVAGPEHLPDVAEAAPEGPTLSPRSDVPCQWDDGQKSVIEATPDQLLLVDAGPGTGKTAVACARVARLIDQHNISPSAIWFISFTRTAVQEIRQRLAAYLSDARAVFGVKVATIDSHAWTLHSGFDGRASLSGSYEENITRVVELIRSHDGVFEHLQSVAHLVVDEAQDVVGSRAELVMGLITSLPSTSGVTVFADEAQAIYGSADDDGGSHASSGGLIQQLRESGLPLVRVSLTDVRRTSDPRLLKIFTDVRKLVLEPSSAGTRFKSVRERVLALAHKKVSELREAIPAGEAAKSTFVLFRRRADALRASSFQGLTPHRLRMSGFPAVVQPWIAVIFTDFTAKRMSRNELESRWPRVTGIAPANLDLKAAWELLVRLAGESTTVVSVPELRKKLSRRSPPPEVCRMDFGLEGPLFGTIHGSKGREADDVALMLPQDRAPDSGRVDPDEEARVLFVGATRARHELVAVHPYRSGGVRVTESGRACTLIRGDTPRAQIEVGRERDLSAAGLAGKVWFPSPDEVHEAQRFLLLNCCRMESAVAFSRGQDFAYHVSAKREAPTFAVLDTHLNQDLFEIGRMVREYRNLPTRLRPSGCIPNVRIFGARSFAVPAGIESAALHEPWCASGFMLAPLIQAFTAIEFIPYER